MSTADTDEVRVLVSGIMKAAREVADRAQAVWEDPGVKDMDSFCAVMVMEYLSGVGQVADFLARTDGKYTPQQIDRAVASVGELLDMKRVTKEGWYEARGESPKKASS